MKANKVVWTFVIGLMVAASACAEPPDGTELVEVRSSALTFVPNCRTSFTGGGVGGAAGGGTAGGFGGGGVIGGAGFPWTHEVIIGDVIGNNGYSYRVGAGDRVCYDGSYYWDTCASGYTYLGHYYNGHGFWLCARNDLAGRTFYVGDVESEYGHYYRVSSSGVTTLPGENWNTCANGSTLLGTWFNTNGFWVCLAPIPPFGPQ